MKISQNAECGLEKTKTFFLFQKTTNIIMKNGKQDKALSLLNECLTIINEMQKSKKGIPYVSKINDYNIHSLKKLGFSPTALAEQKKVQALENASPVNEAINALDILEQAVMNVSPFLEVRKVRTARNTKQVPSMIEKKRQQTLGIRWIVEAAQERKKKTSQTLSKCLAIEFLEAYSKQGKARQKRNETHKTAYANRAHIRSRWW